MILPPDIAAQIASLQRELEALRAENAELRRRLGLDSSTSSKPPSSDGLGKPRAPVSLRERSGRPGGGQKGHKGETLRRIAEPDRIVKHEACACRHCGSSLSAAMAVGMERRQTFDLPQRLIEVTEHQGLVYACAICGGARRAAFPQGLSGPAQYGERIRAAAVYLNAQPLIPEDRTAAARADLFGAHSLSPASVAPWTQRRAQAFLPVAARIGARLRARACAVSTKPAFAWPAGRNGCIQSQPTPSRFTAFRPNGAMCRKSLPAAWSSMTASNPTAASTALRTRSATPTTCANSRR